MRPVCRKAVGISLIDWMRKAELLLQVGIQLPCQSLLLHVALRDLIIEPVPCFGTRILGICVPNGDIERSSEAIEASTTPSLY